MGQAKTKPISRPHANPDYEAGLRLAQAGRHLDSIVRFEVALAADPNDTKVMFALGCAARDIGHDGAAEAFFRRVLAFEPGRLEAVVNLANLLRVRGDCGGAIALLKPALEQSPETPELWLTLGAALCEAGDTTLAETFYREALRLKPRYPQALVNLADIVFDKGDSAETFALYDKALRLEPDNAQARLNRAVLLLAVGDLTRGWRDYEYRLRIAGKSLVYGHNLKRWDGQIRPKLKLLVAGEQGIGDQIAFASLIPELADAVQKAGGTVLFDVEPRLVPLYARSFANVDVRASEITAQGGATMAGYSWLRPGMADAAIPLGSLMRTMRNRLEDFPTPHAFLRADEHESAQWRDWLGSQGEGPFIGICWRSGKRGGLRDREYASLEHWGEYIRALPGAPVVLQYDAAAEEIAELQQRSGRRLLLPPKIDQKREIDRACALIASLAAVVSAPTAVAWQSAALGVPTLKILRYMTWTAFGCDFEPLAPISKAIMPEGVGNWPSAFVKARIVLEAILRNQVSA